MSEQELRDFGGRIQRLINGQDLEGREAYEMFRDVLLDRQPELQQGAFLAALVAKGETVDEIVGAWRAIDEIDTVHEDVRGGAVFENSGTGMDRLKTFNVSSAAAIVAAACGVTMARHGARAITSRCGTVDILEAVGIDVECEPSVVGQSIRTAGIGIFNGMSSRVHPGALGRILSRIRFGSTLNIAASLAHPCRPNQGLRGVYAERLVPKVSEVMRSVGYEKGLVVHGRDRATGFGMDEISILGETTAVRFDGEKRESFTLNPEDVDLRAASYEEIAASNDIAQEAVRFVQVLAGRGNRACGDFTCLNAGAVLWISGVSTSIAQGVGMSRECIGAGRAIGKLREWVRAQSPEHKGSERLERLLEQADIPA
ncbi:MAG: anthranilate phosphoribosyltransferase [Thermodesulfovibrionales bacterium]